MSVLIPDSIRDPSHHSFFVLISGSARGTAKVIAKYLLLVKLGIISMPQEAIEFAPISYTAEEETDPGKINLIIFTFKHLK